MVKEELSQMQDPVVCGQKELVLACRTEWQLALTLMMLITLV
jgi:hypothetical protein